MENNLFYCQVCLRPPTTRLQFNCPSCARTALYEPRLRNIQTLLEKETLSKEVELALKICEEERDNQPLSEGENGIAILSAHYREVQRHASRLKQDTLAIVESCNDLKEEVTRLKAEISGKLETVSQKKTEYAFARKEFHRQSLPALEPLQRASAQVDGRWSALYKKTTESRAFLCKEVASLYGLRQKRRKKGVPGRDLYLLGGVPIIDLRELNGASPIHVTVSIGRLAHLLHLAAHYLSLRLPAEITLPSSANPHTMIHTPLSSYKEPTLPSARKNSNSISSSRQRALHLDKPLPTLATDDPLAYSLFVDAITLLAWDVAWLAKTQGLEIGTRNWEEICAMGKNTWTLFAAQSAPHPNPAGRRPSSSRLPSATRLSSSPASTTATTTVTPSSPPTSSPIISRHPSSSPMSRTPSSAPMGRIRSGGIPGAVINDGPSKPAPPPPGFYSHSSARAFLPAAAESGGGAEFMRSWPYASPVRLIERIKSALASERMGAEWEVLEKEEWEGEEKEREIPEDGAGTDVTAVTNALSVEEGNPQKAEEGIPSRVKDEQERKRERDGGRERKGWMRVRSNTGSEM